MSNVLYFNLMMVGKSCEWNMPNHHYGISHSLVEIRFLWALKCVRWVFFPQAKFERILHELRLATAITAIKKMKRALYETIRCIQKYLMWARTIRDIDSNQKSVKYSFRRSYTYFSFYYFYFTPAFFTLSSTILCFHEEIKIDDDCNMMMVCCIKIQKQSKKKMSTLYKPQNGILFSKFTLDVRQHMCLCVRVGFFIVRNIEKWWCTCAIVQAKWEWTHTCMMEKDKFIKCAAYVNGKFHWR